MRHMMVSVSVALQDLISSLFSSLTTAMNNASA